MRYPPWGVFAVAAATVAVVVPNLSGAAVMASAPQGRGTTTIAATPTSITLVGVRSFAASARHALGSASSTQLSPSFTPTNRSVPLKSPPRKFDVRSTSSPTLPQVNPINISTSSHQAAQGLGALDSYYVNGFDVEPPDQGLCAGNGYVLEPVNDVLAVYAQSDLSNVADDESLNDFLGLPASTFVGDPKCYFDPGTSRFFLTTLAIAPDGTTYVFVAVSRTASPLGSWSIYYLATTTADCAQGDKCLGDQPLLGANKDAIFISTNVFDTTTNSGFNGAELYVLDKNGLVAGAPGKLLNAVALPLASLATPDGSCDPSVGYPCWYSVQPSFSASASQWDTSHAGAEYMLSALDFGGVGDTRIAAWAVTNTSAIHGLPHLTSLTVSWTTLKSEAYVTPQALAQQKNDGLTPTGQFYGYVGVNGLDPDDDRMSQVFSTGTTLWSALGTGLDEKIAKSVEYHNGIAWFGVKPAWSGATFAPTLPFQGYVAPLHADAIYPSIALGSSGKGGMAYTLTGTNYYPSSAYTGMTASGASATSTIVGAGQGSQDGFTEYPGSDSGGSPRWGDYSAAVSSGSQVIVASEYIPWADCSYDYWFNTDLSCGGTRGPQANWGTSLFSVP